MTGLILSADEANRKTCPGCQETKLLSEFYKIKGGPRLSTRCKICLNKASAKWHRDNPGRSATNSREWRKNNPDLAVLRQRRAKLRRRYGLEEADYDALMERQERVCAICGASPNGVGLCVDHDHRSGFIRGLLCHSCNTAIGYFERMVPSLPKVLAYLMSPPALEMNERRVKNPKTR